MALHMGSLIDSKLEEYICSVKTVWPSADVKHMPKDLMPAKPSQCMFALCVYYDLWVGNSVSRTNFYHQYKVILIF
jgi:hypothetical protein